MANKYKKTGTYILCRTCKSPIYLEPKQVILGRKKYCSKPCLYKGDSYINLFKKGHIDLVPKESRGHCEETKRKISEAQRQKNIYKIKDVVKLKEREWKKKVRTSFLWKEWRKSVFERDNYCCMECGKNKCYLEPHHIIPIRSDSDKLFDITNGITLCRPCHQKTIRKEGQYADKYLALTLSK